MPFDSTTITETRPSLRELAEILRDRSRWPAGFRWDYSRCTCCAIGMTWQLWPHLPTEPEDAFGIDPEAAHQIFVDLEHDLGCAFDAVTPENVADAIDAYLDTRP